MKVKCKMEIKSNQIKIKLTTQPNAATSVFFFRSEKKLLVADRCHMAEGCQIGPECFAGSLSRFQYGGRGVEKVKR